MRRRKNSTRLQKALGHMYLQRDALASQVIEESNVRKEPSKVEMKSAYLHISMPVNIAKFRCLLKESKSLAPRTLY